MKIGLLYNAKTTNLGDDIQAFAAESQLPRVDCLIDRENDLRSFTQKKDEPVALVMAAWFMTRKWQWPPDEYVVPKFLGFHYTNFQNYKKKYHQISYDYISGPGADYLKAYGPVGCRDLFTVEQLKKRGIDAYFSGCVTLTLPKMPAVKKEKEYICLVDVDKKVVNAIKKQLQDTDIEVRVISHNEKYWASDASWEGRKAHVREILTVYQNAKCVITRRLHCMLPCLALQVPVLCVIGYADPTRFRPYDEWVEIVSPKQFLQGNYKFNILDPKPNSTEYMKYREHIISEIKEFTDSVREESGPCSKFVKTTYTQDEVMKWQNTLMNKTLKSFMHESVVLYQTIDKQNAEIATLKKVFDKSGEISRLMHENEEYKEKAAYQEKLLNRKSVRLALKLSDTIKNKQK